MCLPDLLDLLDLVDLLERSVGFRESRLDSAADSTITTGSKELEAITEDFGQSLAHLKQIQTTLRKENKDYAQRVEGLMKEMDEMRKGLMEMKMDGRIRQGKLETSLASIHDLIRHREALTDNRMTGMTSLMKERDRQADNRMKSVSDLMQRRDADVNNRMME